MKSMILVGALVAVASAGAQTVRLTPVPSNFMPKMGGYMPQRLALTDTKPAGVTKLPDGLTNAKFGLMHMGGKDYTVCIGDIPGNPSQLFIDTNGNGDLTDDPAPKWTKRQYSKEPELFQHIGTAQVGFHLVGSTDPVTIGVYAFDPKHEKRAQLKDTLLYYTDFGYSGEVKLGKKTYPILLADETGKGDFSASTGVTLMIDTTGDGRFRAIGKDYNPTQPFNIAGTTYELDKIAPDGGVLNFKVSSKKVAEVVPPPPPPTFQVGKVFPGFTAKTMDSQSVQFPSQYKGHIVMLDFWATWCGPCIQELPNVIAAYNKLHEKGFDILGVTLDQKDSAQKVLDFTKSKNMTWPQIYDGGFWQAAIAVKYGVNSIPRAYLVDGDTGILLASGDTLRGEGLTSLIEGFLKKKNPQ